MDTKTALPNCSMTGGKCSPVKTVEGDFICVNCGEPISTFLSIKSKDMTKLHQIIEMVQRDSMVYATRIADSIDEPIARAVADVLVKRGEDQPTAYWVYANRLTNEVLTLAATLKKQRENGTKEMCSDICDNCSTRVYGNPPPLLCGKCESKTTDARLSQPGTVEYYQALLEQRDREVNGLKASLTAKDELLDWRWSLILEKQSEIEHLRDFRNRIIGFFNELHEESKDEDGKRIPYMLFGDDADVLERFEKVIGQDRNG